MFSLPAALFTFSSSPSFSPFFPFFFPFFLPFGFKFTSMTPSVVNVVSPLSNSALSRSFSALVSLSSFSICCLDRRGFLGCRVSSPYSPVLYNGGVCSYSCPRLADVLS
jgi:hypothetical protein